MASVQRGSEVLPTGTIVESYIIRSVLGAGGFGVTYLAEHQRLGKNFALKEYFPRGFCQRQGVSVSALTNAQPTYQWGLERFLQEARALAQFHHRSIVGVSNVFEANGTAYMALSFERGRDMRRWREELGRPPTQSEFDAILVDLLDALEELHAVGLLHRDIAPDNIYIRTDGTPVLLDFGAARQAITQHSSQMSAIVKSGYSPPEQYTTNAKNQGPWSDVYALGATLYRMVTDRSPPEASLRMLDDQCQPASELAAERYRSTFLVAIDDSLTLAPSKRPQSVAAWREKLLGQQTPHSVPVPPEVASAPTAPNPEAQLFNAPPPPAAGDSVPLWKQPLARLAGGALIATGLMMSAWSFTRPSAVAPASIGQPNSTCDQLASIPGDPNARSPTVALEALQPSQAISVCQRAIALAPPQDRPRLQAQLGYVLRAGGQLVESAQQLKASADANYPDGQALYADLLFDGITPVEFDRNRACKLYEAAATGGSLSGLASQAWCVLYGLGGVPRNEKRGAELYRRAADRGFRDAILITGVLLRDGHGVALNVPEAIKWMERAAALGDARASYVLGALYEGAYGVPYDAEKAVSHYRRAVPGLEKMGAHNMLDAISVLGHMFREGNGVGKDEVRAAKLYEKSVALGSGAAMGHLGYLYAQGAGVTLDFDKAIDLFRRGIARQDENSAYNLALLHADGRGVPQSYSEAMKWYRFAADKGHAESEVAIGTLFFNGHGVRQDYPEALRWYRRAAERNNGAGMSAVGLMYELGHGTRKDFAEARRWYMKAADLGNLDAVTHLGELYERGNGLPANGAEAVRWYRIAANRGNDGAMYRLGEVYRLGTGVAVDYPQAMAWYRRAIEKGHDNSTVALGLMFENGEGTPENLPEAIRLYRQAADKGNAPGMYYLARLFETGRGVQRSCTDARAWYQKSADAGDADAKKKLGEPAIRNCR